MATDEVQDELDAIEAIYGDDFTSLGVSEVFLLWVAHLCYRLSLSKMRRTCADSWFASNPCWADANQIITL